MMQFSVGDKVVHPQYGPGQIVGAEHRELVEGLEHYYVIELLMDESTLFIPRRKMDELGVRPVMSQAKLARVLSALRAAPRRLSKDFKVRQARIREKLATARPIKVAETVRDLIGRQRRGYLTKVDKRLLKRGRDLLAAEMALVNGIDVIYAHQTIDAALRGGKVREADAAEPVRVIGTGLTSEQQTWVQKLLRRVQAGEG
jgi:CarD family transcriptional regulator